VNENLQWHEWQGLHQLYETGQTKQKIQKHSYITHLIGTDFLYVSVKNSKVLLAEKHFRAFYERNLLDRYLRYKQFLESNDIVNPNSNYTENDIQAMMVIQENKEAIVNNQETRRGLSSKFFKTDDSKHIENHPGLEKAILKLIDLEQFPEKDPKNNQFLYVITCKNPEAIILCENIYFLKLPWKARDKNIELWFAGGNNIEKLNHLPKRDEPIYYSCDWDFDGLAIYQRIKEYIPAIKLLYPSSVSSAKPVNTSNHSSQWKPGLRLSGLDETIYSQQELRLLQTLILANEWIEEETNDFDALVQLNGILGSV
jgi:hypothetical protein